jgi:hypothetical protein
LTLQYGKRYGKDNETKAEQGVAATQATNQAIALKPTLHWRMVKGTDYCV